MSIFLRASGPIALCLLGACSGDSSPLVAADVPGDVAAAVDVPTSPDAGATLDVATARDVGTAATDTPAAPDTPDASDPPPMCVQTLITAMMTRPVGNPPMSVYRCTYQNATVYYLPPQCCDQFSALMSSDCAVICAPDGGFAGNGDGRCTDFSRASCTLVWQDGRTR